VFSLRFKALTTLLISSGAVSAHAEETNTMEKMVVTAAGYEQEISQAPASISIIDREQLENRSYRDVTDALKTVPGVTVTNGGSRQDISIRGMPAEYTVLLVDGKKQSGRESQPSGSGGFEQDWLPPLEAIERIEVVRGPMSTLYGSDAIGGVINIITRKNHEKWSGNLRVEAKYQDHKVSGNEYQRQFYLAGPVIKDRLNINLSGIDQTRKEDEIERGYGAKQLNSYQAGIHLTPNDTDTFSLDLNRHVQQRISTAGLSLPSTSSSTETNNNRHSVALTHSGNYDTLTGKTFFQKESVENEGREITIDNTLFNSQWSLPIADHYVTTGLNYQQEKLDDNDTNANSATAIKNTQWSIYAEDEWLITDAFALTLGLRVDDNERFDTHVSPRVFGVLSLNDNWTVKSGVSTGYRTPELRELETDWIQESNGGDVYGNPDLEPEKSTSKEIGLYYFSDQGSQANLTFFHNDFKDKITTIECPSAICGAQSGRRANRYNTNIDEAVTKGLELATSIKASENVTFGASYSYTHSEQLSGDNKGQPLTQIPRHLINANINWSVTHNINTWLNMTHRGEEVEPVSLTERSPIVAPSITYVDLGGSWQVMKNLKLMAGVYNLFDQETTYDKYSYVEDRRRYWLALDVGF
jgi:outer membrane receptor for ferrienterochelin and colicins